MSYFNSTKVKWNFSYCDCFTLKRENSPDFLCMNAMHTSVSSIFVTHYLGYYRWATPQRIFQTVERVRWIWQNSLKTSYTKLMIYDWWNSKPIVGIDSYHRHTSFSYTTYDIFSKIKKHFEPLCCSYWTHINPFARKYVIYVICYEIDFLMRICSKASFSSSGKLLWQ